MCRLLRGLPLQGAGRAQSLYYAFAGSFLRTDRRRTTVARDGRASPRPAHSRTIAG
jgi:hypothetical protein